MKNKNKCKDKKCDNYYIKIGDYCLYLDEYSLPSVDYISNNFIHLFEWDKAMEICTEIIRNDSLISWHKIDGNPLPYSYSYKKVKLDILYYDKTVFDDIVWGNTYVNPSVTLRGQSVTFSGYNLNSWTWGPSAIATSCSGIYMSSPSGIIRIKY